MNKYKLLVLLIALLGCNSQSMAWFKKATCVKQANGRSQLPPCWLDKHPENDIVLHGVKHVGSDGWRKAKQALVQEASAQFAAMRYGIDVTTSAVLFKTTEDNNGQVDQQGRSSRIFSFEQSDGAVNVRVRIKDYYYEPATEKISVWVEEQR